MSDTILEIKELKKSFGKKEVLHGVSFDIKRGGIYGLVGPNGAGKTTIMKIIGGLVYPSGGSIKYYAKSGESVDMQTARRSMSFMIETPYLKGFSNARQNLEKQRLQKGIADKGVIDRVLDTVGLSEVEKKKEVRKYSLGMKQRLGIANALMCDPELLVLDEPVNGLDPAGIREIRELLLKLNREKGVTILISSHILSELSQLCTDYIFIGSGSILERTSAHDLEKGSSGVLEIGTNNNAAAEVLLRERFGDKLEVCGDMFKIHEDITDIAELSSALFGAGAVPVHIVCSEGMLEDYYLDKVLESEGGIE